MYGEENRVVELPARRQLREISASYNLGFSDANVKSFLQAVCESLRFSGGSRIFDTGPVLDLHEHSRSAGGALLPSVIAGEDGLDPRQKG